MGFQKSLMSHNVLKEGAILVADSHYAPWREPFIDFLRALKSGAKQTNQLILMGDNFDLLFGPVTQTHQLNAEAIELLNTLSHSIEIIYLEGNHDFRLSSLFPNIRVIPLEKQPLYLAFGDEKIALLHGDIHTPLGYRIYTALIRNSYILKVLNAINQLFDGVIIERLRLQMERKKHCHPIADFETIAHRLESESWINQCDVVIEGHYHQNQSFHFKTYRYINLGAFACNERVYVVKSSQNQINLDEVIFSKEPR